MKIKNILIICLIASFTFGCAFFPKRDCIAVVKHSEKEYDVCIGDKQVQNGDRVEFLRDECTRGVYRTGAVRCKKVRVGQGTVIKTLDEHLSTVELDKEFQISEKMIVKKINENEGN